jgi:hypothetical protein
VNKRDTQTHNATCAVGLTKRKFISWRGSKILGDKENLKLSERDVVISGNFDLLVQFLKHETSFK